MEEIVYLNGALVPRSQARVSAFDHGFLYGYGLFETMRAYNGIVFLLERHLNRLLKSAEALGFGPTLSEANLSEACRDTLAANSLKDARLRLTVTRGELDAFPGHRGGGTPTVLVTAKEYHPLPDEAYRKGYRAAICTLRQNSTLPLPQHKTTSYLLNLLARLEAEAAWVDEVLLLNERGHVAEGSISNVFFVASGSLVTPSPDSGILPGITRQVVIEMTKAHGIAVKEVEVKPEDFAGFDEAFLTNSMIELMPLVEIRHQGKTIRIGSGKPGPLTRQLMTAYRDMVAAETGAK